MRRLVPCFALALSVLAVTGSSAATSTAIRTPCPSPGLEQRPDADRYARAGDLSLQLSSVWPDESHVDWRFSLTNRTNKRLRLGFGTSQYAEVTIRGPGYSYRWSQGKGFLQALWSMTLLPHETYVRCLGSDAIDIGEPTPGRYELRAWIKTLPRVERRRTWWILDG